MQDPAFAIGRTVRAIRVRQGVTQQTLATEAGLSLRTLSRVEAGEDTTVSTLAALASVLDVSLADLMVTDEAAS